jgi:hypothetical protein
MTLRIATYPLMPLRRHRGLVLIFYVYEEYAFHFIVLSSYAKD